MDHPAVNVPRKRPRQQRSARMVEAILEAAARILELRGLEGFNTNAVADLAGASVGSLYQYFPNKNGLLAALIHRELDTLRSEVRAAVEAAGGDDLLADLAPLVAAAVRHQAARPVLARLLDAAEEQLSLDPETRSIAADIAAAVAELLRRHVAMIVPQEPVEAAADIVAIARGLIDAAARRPPLDPRALEARVARAVLGYLTFGVANGANLTLGPQLAR